MNSGVDRVFRLFFPFAYLKNARANATAQVLNLLRPSFFFPGIFGHFTFLTTIRPMTLSIFLNLPTHAVLF